MTIAEARARGWTEDAIYRYFGPTADHASCCRCEHCTNWYARCQAKIEASKSDRTFSYMLYGGDVLDKGGFQDGDLFDDIWLDLARTHLGYKPGCDRTVLNKYPHHDFLCNVVRTLLLPRLPIAVEIEMVETPHNPARASSIDGGSFSDADGRVWRDLLNEIAVPVSFKELESVFVAGSAARIGVVHA